MNIFLTQKEDIGNTKVFLLHQVITAAAHQQGHQITSLDEADLVIVFGEALHNPQFVGKKYVIVDAEEAFNAPENTLTKAFAEATPYVLNEHTESVPPSFTTPYNVNRLIAITACPTGVTQTFMAAEAIMNYAQQQGWDVKVETRGQIGVKDILTEADIAEADLVLVATDVETDLSKFEGKMLYRTSTREVLNNTESTFQQALTQATVYHAPKEEDVGIITPPPRDYHNDFATCDATKKIVAVTACPTGVTQTFMSAEAIMLYAKTQGWCVKVETHGQMGADNLITAEEVAAADLVFAATDIEIDLAKFEGKPLYRTSTSATLKNIAQEFDKAFMQATPYTHTKQEASKNACCSTSTTSECCQLKCGVARWLPLILIVAIIIGLVAYFKG
ncbi:PTS fructose-like transporter subunit IIB [Pasteurella multocida]